MNVQGGCHCGAIRFRATVDPAKVAICHCTDCQQLTGTAYRVSVAARGDGFELLAGEPAIYIKVGDSGNRRAMAFCGHCGSQLYAYGADEAVPGIYNLRVGCLDERRLLAPQRQKWCGSALPWASDISALPAAAGE